MIYQYGACLKTLAYPASGKFGAANVDGMLLRRGKERLVKEELSRTAFNGRHRRLCPDKLAVSGQQGVKWISRAIRMTLIKAADLKVHRKCRPLKLSSSASFLGLSPRGTSVNAVIKCLVE